MALIALSDLHIRGTQDPLYPSLLEVIRKTKEGDHLVLAGDVFDLFIGNKAFFKRQYRDFFDVVMIAAQRDVNVHYIEGNHDFLLRKAFPRDSRIHVHSHDLELKIDGIRFFIAHGDTVDQTDLRYLALRKFLRSFPLRAFVSAAPGFVINGIGQVGKRASQVGHGSGSLDPDQLNSLRQKYRGYAHDRFCRGYDFVILGHCHDLDQWETKEDGKLKQYVNMGFPPVHRLYLEWQEGDARIKRKSFERS